MKICGYIGVSGKAHRILHGYIGIGGKAKKIKRAYIGVGGVARLVFDDAPQKFTITALRMRPDGYAEIDYTGSATEISHCLMLTAYYDNGVLAQRITLAPDYSQDDGRINTYTSTEALNTGTKYRAYLYDSLAMLRPVAPATELVDAEMLLKNNIKE